MKDALVGFCGCRQMIRTMSSKMRAKMQTITMLHASIRARASRAWDRVTHSATTHATAENEKRNKKDQVQRDRGTFKSKEIVSGQE